MSKVRRCFVPEVEGVKSYESERERERVKKRLARSHFALGGGKQLERWGKQQTKVKLEDRVCERQLVRKPNSLHYYSTSQRCVNI